MVERELVQLILLEKGLIHCVSDFVHRIPTQSFKAAESIAVISHNFLSMLQSVIPSVLFVITLACLFFSRQALFYMGEQSHRVTLFSLLFCTLCC